MCCRVCKPGKVEALSASQPLRPKRLDAMPWLTAKCCLDEYIGHFGYPVVELPVGEPT